MSTIGQFPKAVNPRRKMDQGQVTVTTASTEIAIARSTRTAVVVTNLSTTVAVFVGENPALTTDYQLEPEKSITLDAKGAIHGITASGTVDVTFADSFL